MMPSVLRIGLALCWASGVSGPEAGDDSPRQGLKPGLVYLFFDDGGFQRFTAEYDWTDSIELTGGVVFYQSGDLRRTTGIGNNDRVFGEVQYNF